MPRKISREPRRSRRRANAQSTTTISIDEDDGTQVEAQPARRTTRRVRTTRRERVQKNPMDDPAFKLLLAAFCKETAKKGVEGVLQEFTAIKTESAAKPPPPTATAAFLANKTKNRYNDVVCLDETRVTLKWPPGSCDYVHANWIDYLDEKRFICTQGPIQDTINDFWRLVWQEKCKSIVMLCEIMEQGKRKCEPYWPVDEGAVISTTSGLKIKNLGVEQHEENVLVVAKLEVSFGEETIEVKHFKWNNWPDRCAPPNKMAPFRLLHRLHELTPALIHCSAGIGRTGTVVGLHMAVQVLSSGVPLNMVSLVKDLRARRHGSVQMDVQYLYMHRSLMALAEKKGVLKPEEMEPFASQYEAFMKTRGG